MNARQAAVSALCPGISVGSVFKQYGSLSDEVTHFIALMFSLPKAPGGPGRRRILRNVTTQVCADLGSSVRDERRAQPRL